MLVAGGTDLYPKLKRRQFDPDTLVGLSHLGELRVVPGEVWGGSRVGARIPFSAAAAHEALRAAHPGYAEAAGLVSSPPLRNVGTIGGNLCVDTRCNYYDMTYEWRKSIGFCIKKGGAICLFAPSNPPRLARFASGTAPVASR